MRETMPAAANHRCTRCGETLPPWDVHYRLPDGTRLCEDCMEAALRRWRRREGDVIDRFE